MKNTYRYWLFFFVKFDNNTLLLIGYTFLPIKFWFNILRLQRLRVVMSKFLYDYNEAINLL